MTLIEEKTLADHDINVRSTRQELRLLEEQLKKHGGNEPQPSPTVTADPDTVSMQSETTTEIQKILDYLDNELHPLVSPDNWNVYSELYDMVSELENLPPSPTPSRPHGQWIPVSERLPEKEDDVLCCRDNKTMAIMHFNPVLTTRYPKGFSMVEGAFSWRQDNVVAWMPLPEPYHNS